jgi:outer membrane protein OmpA-like peptidoglycan-associated protein
MNEPSPPSLPERHASEEVPAHAADMQELRRLLLGEEAEQVDRLERRVDRVAAMEEEGQIPALSRSLPEAISLHGEDSRLLANALGPTIERTLHFSIRRNPKPFIDALFPIIGPAIRRSIAEALRGMVETINRTLEHSLSLRSLQWRFEAARTGRPFSEVVISHTLAYRVEHLFLIERSSGLPIQHVTSERAAELDPDVISGMMSAVQDFMRESFGATREQNLNRVEIGDLTLLIEPGPRVVLAAVVRGVLARELSERLQDLIEVIHLQHGQEFQGFSGDMTAFEHVRPLLNAGLHMEMRPVESSGRWLWIGLGLFFLGSAIWLAFLAREYQRFQGYVDGLHDEPGLIVVNAGRAENGWYVRGLRDPFAIVPPADEFDAGRITYHWQPYLALDTTVLLRRIEAHWEAPPTVRLRFSGDTLRASGMAPADWARRARERATSTPGVSQYDDTALRTINGATLGGITERIGQSILFFEGGSAELRAGQEDAVRTVAGLIHELGAIRQLDGVPRVVVVTGHASREGDPAVNNRLREARAAIVREALIGRGVPAEALRVASGASVTAGRLEEPFLDRSVTFTVVSGG